MDYWAKSRYTNPTNTCTPQNNWDALSISRGQLRSFLEVTSIDKDKVGSRLLKLIKIPINSIRMAAKVNTTPNVL